MTFPQRRPHKAIEITRDLHNQGQATITGRDARSWSNFGGLLNYYFASSISDMYYWELGEAPEVYTKTYELCNGVVFGEQLLGRLPKSTILLWDSFTPDAPDIFGQGWPCSHIPWNPGKGWTHLSACCSRIPRGETYNMPWNTNSYV